MPTLHRRPGSVWTRGVVACIVACIASAGLLTGCSAGPVDVDAPEVAGSDARACRSLLDDLPSDLAGLEARAVSPSGAAAAAWGDPAVVLACGVGEPEGFDRFSACLEVDGVGWFVPPEQEEDPDSDVLLTAVGYQPSVSLLVPAEHRGATSAAALTALAGPVRRHLALVDGCT